MLTHHALERFLRNCLRIAQSQGIFKSDEPTAVRTETPSRTEPVMVQGSRKGCCTGAGSSLAGVSEFTIRTLEVRRFNTRFYGLFGATHRTGTGIFLTMYSHTASMLYFNCAEIGTTGAASAMVPWMKACMPQDRGVKGRAAGQGFRGDFHVDYHANMLLNHRRREDLRQWAERGWKCLNHHQGCLVIKMRATRVPSRQLRVPRPRGQ